MKHSFMRRIAEIGATFSCEVLKFIKISFVVGSTKGMFFSLSQCLSPLLGWYGGSHSAIAAFGLRTFYAFCTGFGFYAGALYHIPSFCGALYLSSRSKGMRIVLPLTCIALFLAHPLGRAALPYALYWLIPAAVPFLPQSFFMQALGTTFVMHGVGSVIWLYTRNLDASIWNALTSIVWAERIVYAACMTGAYYAINTLCTYAPVLKKRYQALYS